MKFTVRLPDVLENTPNSVSLIIVLKLKHFFKEVKISGNKVLKYVSYAKLQSIRERYEWKKTQKVAVDLEQTMVRLNILMLAWNAPT